MPFVKDIEKYKSVSIVGLEKNTGKTECLNYILSKLKNSSKRIAITSIGIDGENVDQVNQMKKPEIEIFEGMFFVTPELLYSKRKLVSEIIDVSSQSTCLGKLVTAQAKSNGKVIISGPTTNNTLVELIKKLQNFNVDLTIIDGALSRKSTGSPVVSHALILNTGAAVSTSIDKLVNATKYSVDLIKIEKISALLKEKLVDLDNGIWAIDAENELKNLNISSVLMLGKIKENLLSYGTRFYISGAITDGFIEFLIKQKQVSKIEIIVRDFTKIFIDSKLYYSFLKKGGKISVIDKTELIAICFNPVAPNGIILNSEELKLALEKELNLPAYNIKMM